MGGGLQAAVAATVCNDTRVHPLVVVTRSQVHPCPRLGSSHGKQALFMLRGRPSPAGHALGGPAGHGAGCLVQRRLRHCNEGIFQT